MHQKYASYYSPNYFELTKYSGHDTFSGVGSWQYIGHPLLQKCPLCPPIFASESEVLKILFTSVASILMYYFLRWGQTTEGPKGSPPEQATRGIWDCANLHNVMLLLFVHFGGIRWSEKILSSRDIFFWGGGVAPLPRDRRLCFTYL